MAFSMISRQNFGCFLFSINAVRENPFIFYSDRFPRFVPTSLVNLNRVAKRNDWAFSYSFSLEPFSSFGLQNDHPDTEGKNRSLNRLNSFSVTIICSSKDFGLGVFKFQGIAPLSSSLVGDQRCGESFLDTRHGLHKAAALNSYDIHSAMKVHLAKRAKLAHRVAL